MILFPDLQSLVHKICASEMLSPQKIVTWLVERDRSICWIPITVV